MLNHITIMGRMLRDPELRHTGSGVAVASFTLAVDRGFKASSAGEFVSKYFTRVSMAVESGKLLIRTCTDKDGNKRRTAEVIAENVYFGDSRSESAASKSAESGNYTGHTYSATESPPQSDFALLEDDDAQLPF